MAQPRGFGLNGKSYYTNVAKPQEVWCSFVVDSTNANGLGTSSNKSNGYIETVFMHTTQTPGKVNTFLNPNPPVGYAAILFRNNFNVYLGNLCTVIPPVTSPTTTSLTANAVYVITVVGTTTPAQWLTYGLPPGFTPTVGQAFVAKSTVTITGTGRVGLPGVPSIAEVAMVGAPSTMAGNSSIAANAGAYFLVQFTTATSSSVTTLVPSAPADGTVVSLQLCFDGSSVTIDGL